MRELTVRWKLENTTAVHFEARAHALNELVEVTESQHVQPPPRSWSTWGAATLVISLGWGRREHVVLERIAASPSHYSGSWNPWVWRRNTSEKLRCGDRVRRCIWLCIEDVGETCRWQTAQLVRTFVDCMISRFQSQPLRFCGPDAATVRSAWPLTGESRITARLSIVREPSDRGREGQGKS